VKLTFRIAAVAIAVCTVVSARSPLVRAVPVIPSVPVVPVVSQGDLDTFMKAVLERRDENWKKVQQFILDETERIEVLGLGGMRMWGQEREYQWFIREGFFVKRPTTSDGVKIGEADRQKYEDRYFERQKARDKRKAEEAAKKAADARAGEAPPVKAESAGTVDDIIKQTTQPQFIDSAYFMEFKFEGGQYALAGKEQFEGHEVLRIEYYPTKLFDVDGSEDKNRKKDDKPRDPKSKGAQFERTLEHLMNKNSMVTIWVEPKTKQIVKYTFDNVQLDYLPAAWLARMEALRASMTMSEPFKGVWLPRDMEFQFSALLAVGPFDVHYRVGYHDYREAVTSGRIIKKDRP
jgi:hypothetical protein